MTYLALSRFRVWVVVGGAFAGSRLAFAAAANYQKLTGFMI